MERKERNNKNWERKEKELTVYSKYQIPNEMWSSVRGESFFEDLKFTRWLGWAIGMGHGHASRLESLNVATVHSL